MYASLNSGKAEMALSSSSRALAPSSISSFGDGLEYQEFAFSGKMPGWPYAKLITAAPEFRWRYNSMASSEITASASRWIHPGIPCCHARQRCRSHPAGSRARTRFDCQIYGPAQQVLSHPTGNFRESVSSSHCPFCWLVDFVFHPVNCRNERRPAFSGFSLRVRYKIHVKFRQRVFRKAAAESASCYITSARRITSSREFGDKLLFAG